MKLISLSVRNLHGAVNLTLHFSSGVNLLVGANGCGKTSVLNLIVWLTTPSIDRLCTTIFSEARLKFSLEKSKYEIICTQRRGRMVLRLTKNSRKRFHPLSARIAHRAQDLVRNVLAVETARQGYSELMPDAKERALFMFLRNLEKPRLISLQRTIAVTENPRPIVDQAFGGRVPQPTPLDEVRRLTATEYGQFRTRLIKLGATLQNEVILSSFSISEQALAHGSTATPKGVSIPKLEEQIRVLLEKGFLQQSSTKEFARNLRVTASSFFHQVKAAQSAGQALELRRIERIAEIFTTYEREAEQAYARLRLFLGCLNGFFLDSKKEIFFDEDTANLFFRYPKKAGDKRDLSFLSSGEQQIFILLAYIAFLKGGNILVDEPEVSLHPRWQEKFLPAAQNLIMPDTQLILATHSPAIVGHNTDKVIPLV